MTQKIGSLRAKVRYAMIDTGMFQFLQNEAQLRATLISNDFASQPSSIMPLALLPACISIISNIA